MDHEYIKQFNLIDQYLLGKLAVDEAEEFENHFIDCSECAEELNVTRSFIHDLKGLVVEQTVLSGNRRPVARWWHFPQLAPVRSWATVIALASVVLAGVFAFYAFRRVGQLENQLRAAKEETSAIREQYQRGLETVAASEEQHQKDRQELTKRLEELEQQLNTDGAVNQSSRRTSEAAEINFPIYALVSVARTQVRGPVEIAPPASSSRFALSIPVEDRADFNNYRVTIVNDQGATVWRRSGFRPDAYHALSLTLNSNFLAPGNYELKVEGLIPPNQWNTVGSYPFRIVKRR